MENRNFTEIDEEFICENCGKKVEKLGLNVILDGYGYITEQSLPEGTKITPNLDITLKAAPKFS